MAAANTGNSVFLIRALEKILADKETKRNQHQQLRKACEEALSKPRPPVNPLICTLSSLLTYTMDIPMV